MSSIRNSKCSVDRPQSFCPRRPTCGRAPAGPADSPQRPWWRVSRPSHPASAYDVKQTHTQQKASHAADPGIECHLDGRRTEWPRCVSGGVGGGGAKGPAGSRLSALSNGISHQEMRPFRLQSGLRNFLLFTFQPAAAAATLSLAVCLLHDKLVCQGYE